MSVFPADQHWTPCELLENNYFCFVCTNQGILIIFYVTVSSLIMFQQFQHKCFFTVCWLYLHVSEFPTAACGSISASSTINSVLLKNFASAVVPFLLTIFFATLFRSPFYQIQSCFLLTLNGTFAAFIFHVFSITSFRDFVEYLTKRLLALFDHPPYLLRFAIKLSVSVNVLFH